MRRQLPENVQSAQPSGVVVWHCHTAWKLTRRYDTRCCIRASVLAWSVGLRDRWRSSRDAKKGAPALCGRGARSDGHSHAVHQRSDRTRVRHNLRAGGADQHQRGQQDRLPRAPV